MDKIPSLSETIVAVGKKCQEDLAVLTKLAEFDGAFEALQVYVQDFGPVEDAEMSTLDYILSLDLRTYDSVLGFEVPYTLHLWKDGKWVCTEDEDD